MSRDLPARRCLWCNGGGPLVEMTVAGRSSTTRIPVHAHHESQLRAFLQDSERHARRVLPLLGTILIAAIPALAIAGAFRATAVTAAAAVVLLSIGVAAWRFPLAAPAFMRALGARNARRATRAVAALCAATGILLAAAAVGI